VVLREGGRGEAVLKRVGLGGLAVAFAAALIGCETTNQDYQPAQPIVYSHAVHAGDLQIPCQYCHYGAERGRFAGIPPAIICMNCHAQVQKEHPEVVKISQAIDNDELISWVRVHRIPDHAYFNHRAHIDADVACQTCHGNIQEMALVKQDAPLTMGWCLDCHRQQPLASGEAAQANRLTDCATCHH
jgi:hypothetical protein